MSHSTCVKNLRDTAFTMYISLVDIFIALSFRTGPSFFGLALGKKQKIHYWLYLLTGVTYRPEVNTSELYFQCSFQGYPTCLLFVTTLRSYCHITCVKKGQNYENPITQIQLRSKLQICLAYAIFLKKQWY